MDPLLNGNGNGSETTNCVALFWLAAVMMWRLMTVARLPATLRPIAELSRMFSPASVTLTTLWAASTSSWKWFLSWGNPIRNILKLRLFPEISIPDSRIKKILKIIRTRVSRFIRQIVAFCGLSTFDSKNNYFFLYHIIQLFSGINSFFLYLVTFGA